jgi:hypothetical protein
LWQKVRGYDLKKLTSVIEEIYHHRNYIIEPTNLSEDAQELLPLTKEEKYYGGHQHRLGHYFRHLYQSFKYLDQNELLNESQKRFYGKTFRAQLSTYEQALLFINSITSLGMNWEFTYVPEKSAITSPYAGLITNYNLIKNLPGTHLFKIKYRTYYPHVDFENY